MSKRKKVYVFLAVLGAIVILLLTAKAIADNATHIIQEPVTASPDVTLKNPEPLVISADKDAVLPKEAAPEVVTEPAPPAPSNIPPAPFVSTNPLAPYVPFYQAPITPPQVPLTSPQPPLSQPILPSPVQPLVPIVERPLEGVLEPLRPVTDPLLGAVEDVLPSLPKTIEVGIEIK